MEDKITKDKRKIKQIERRGIWGMKYSVIPNFIEKQTFINNDEYKLYRCLKGIYFKTNIEIFVQVALNQILEINTKRKAKDISKNFIGRSIDFVLYDTKDAKIKCCIELNGISHNREDRKERDEYLKEIFEFVQIPIIFIKTQDFYDQEEIKNIIEEEIDLKEKELKNYFNI